MRARSSSGRSAVQSSPAASAMEVRSGGMGRAGEGEGGRGGGLWRRRVGPMGGGDGSAEDAEEESTAGCRREEQSAALGAILGPATSWPDSRFTLGGRYLENRCP